MPESSKQRRAREDRAIAAENRRIRRNEIIRRYRLARAEFARRVEAGWRALADAERKELDEWK